MTLRNFANVQAFGIDDGTSGAGAPTTSQINFVDSNDGIIVNEAANLAAELTKSGLANDVAEVNIKVAGEIVETILPEQLTDTPLGLTYEGSVEDLDVSLNAENIITAEVVFNNDLPTSSVDYTVTSGQETGASSTSNTDDSDGDCQRYLQSPNHRRSRTVFRHQNQCRG